jgi:hypothetical protein
MLSNLFFFVISAKAWKVRVFVAGKNYPVAAEDLLVRIVLILKVLQEETL